MLGWRTRAGAVVVGVVVAAACAAPTKPQPVTPLATTPTTTSTTTTTIAPGLTRVTADLGCAAGTDAASLDRFFAGRVGPVLGWDYPHVLPLGEDRWLWLFQDVFVDHEGSARDLHASDFVHNAAVVQDGRCFTLVHGGTTTRPRSFALGPGVGSDPTDEELVRRWWWPLGAALDGPLVRIVWVEMRQDADRPADADGLPYAPAATWLGTYRAADLSRVAFEPAPNDGVQPIYGYGVVTEGRWSYLFGNSYLQDFADEGGFWGPDHSATRMFLGRVPAGRLDLDPQYWDGDAWVDDARRAEPISERFFWENPMQPVVIDGEWYATTKVDGFFSQRIVVERASRPQGPWRFVREVTAVPRGGDPDLSSTYHAYPLPWRDGGDLVVSLSSNAWNMVRDAYPRPSLYRPSFQRVPLVEEPPPTTVAPTTTAPVPTTAGPAVVATGEPDGVGPQGRDLHDEAVAAGLSRG